jgi:hypothetical protein
MSLIMYDFSLGESGKGNKPAQSETNAKYLDQRVDFYHLSQLVSLSLSLLLSMSIIHRRYKFQETSSFRVV